ncbi:MAG: RNA polymerase sigma factor [Bacteroidetes bacterium]|nr:RNA polymerase sigma factor [Bacteroidota bacterium]
MSLNYFNIEDSELVKLASGQDERAFTELLNRYGEFVRGCCIKFSKNDGDADDLFQKACLKAWKALPKFRADCHFKSWMYKIARNLAYDFSDWKRRRAEVPLFLGSKQEEQSKWGEKTWADIRESGTSVLGTGALPMINSLEGQESPDRKLERRENSKELGRLLEDSLKNLPPNHQECLRCLSEGMTYEEIAKVQKVPVGTVMSRVFNARKKAQRNCANLKTFKV